MALYFPFALYTQALLSETLFLTLLLGAFVALAGWPRAPAGLAARRGGIARAGDAHAQPDAAVHSDRGS
ncbi:MAG: hypothetical protein U0Z44_16230 [Kouleothrix sp.]